MLIRLDYKADLRRRIHIPASAHPPVRANANDAGSGATLEPGFEGLVPFARLNESTYINLVSLGVTVTLIDDDESLIYPRNLYESLTDDDVRLRTFVVEPSILKVISSATNLPSKSVIPK